ncbi:MAG: SDR family NAD(P)-dependent oxidoreductase [Ancrocorticia populi]|uniref:SDR family NAD(P)-dependent oxidoreductase n=1 Tax=Ancrocorticia populi TaxID=2175228 RepID=UPI003F8F6DA0
MTTVPAAERILITGASRGIGQRMAVELARPGRTLILVARTQKALTNTVAACEEKGAIVCSMACLLEKRDRLAQMLEIIRTDGGVDMVVNCAGVFGSEENPWEADPEDWWYTQLVDVRAPYLIQHSLVPGMLERGGGRIIDLSSGAAIKDRPDTSAYYVSKTALMRLGGSLHLAGYDQGLRVLELAPGVVYTDMTKDAKMHIGRTEWTEPSEAAKIAASFADGELDGLSGCQVRAGSDSLDDLKKRSAEGVGENSRRLRLTDFE